MALDSYFFKLKYESHTKAKINSIYKKCNLVAYLHVIC